MILKRYLVLALLGMASAVHADDGFKSIFDGKTLAGWNAAEMSYWSVEDGAITAQCSDKNPAKHNQFLLWSGGLVDDFELKLKFRLFGTEKANSGIQFRSAYRDRDAHVIGYQADIDMSGRWLGSLYDEATGRRGLAGRGQRTEIAADGTRTSSQLSGPDVINNIKFDQWNDYHITARGGHITLKINGHTTAEVIDNETAHRDLIGNLALQLHSGPPMKVQFKDIKIKRLPLADDRKKIVIIAGKPSHPSGQHEFNAGVKLLTKRLNKLDSVVAANYHNGWPADETAFDNANAVVIYSDGQGRHAIEGHWDRMEALTKKGVGMMCMHYAVHVDPGVKGGKFQQWLGGYYESNYSSNPHWVADLKVNKDHPIGRGVDSKKVYDEWYFCMRFRKDMKDVASILQAYPGKQTRSKNGYPPKPYPHIIKMLGRLETLMWAVERPDGGRGVGFTGGHWHRNWANEAQRRAVLNAMLWIAGAQVPEGGVQSDPVTEEELNQNLDKKRKMLKVKLTGDDFTNRPG